MPDQGHGTGRFGEGLKAVAAPYIAIAIEGQMERVQNTGRRWQFGIVIPKAFVGLGQLKIETGFGPLKLLRLSTLSLGQEFVPINVSGHYGIKWVSDEVDHDYKSAVQQDIDKIMPNDGYVFTGSGKIRSQIGILTWGDNYIFVWKNPDYSIPNTVDHYFIAGNGDWCAAVVTLPTDQDETVEAWLRDQFGAAITTGARQWGILYPPPLDRDTDGNITVGSLSELFLGFADEGDEDRSEDAIATHIEKQTVTIRPGADQKRVASIAIPSELDNYPLTLTWGERTLQPILRERRRQSEQAVEFAFRTTNGPVKIALHKAAARGILSQVRARNADVLSVHIPQGIVGTLNIREGMLGWTEMARFECIDRASTLNDEQIATLMTWLRKRTVDVRLIFGCFGEFTASAENSIPTHTALSKGLRERLEWYLRFTGKGSASYGIASLSHAAIVAAVGAPNQNPTAVARQNQLLNELKVRLGATREQ